MNISLSRRTDLGLQALAALAAKDGRVGGRELAEEIGTTTQFLPQVLGPLVREGWVDSERGPNGGYLLTADLESIPLIAVIEASEGETTTGRCVLRDGPCPGARGCPVHEAWMAARAVLVSGLDTPLAAALSRGGSE